MTGIAGAYGTGILVDKYYDKLIHRLPKSMVERAKYYRDDKQKECIINTVTPYSDYISEVADGGIFKALWKLAEEYKTGLTVQLDSIPVMQEIIEICEVFDINPYMLNTTGSLLIITEHGNQIVRSLRDIGVRAGVIGYTTDSNDKIIENSGESRYLESRVKDELLRLE